MGRNTRFAISRTASRGVQCSPASSLLSSLNLRTSSSKTVPIEWLSIPAGERSMSGSRNLLISVPMASALERLELVAELEILKDVLDVGRKAVEVVLEIGEQFAVGCL